MTTSTALTVAERVAAGAAWLDEHVPDWIDRIDLNRLDITRCTACLLGQLFGNYDLAPLVGADDYGAPHEWGDEVAEALGFEAQGDGRGFRADYQALDAQWRHLIAARRAGRSTA